MSKEIERKWRLPAMPEWIIYSDFREVPCVFITQFYLVVGDEVEFRIRRYGDKYFAARKIGVGLVREEKEVPISRHSFEQLAKLADGQAVRKNRFRVRCDGRILEVDQYLDDLEGLVTLECEFGSEAEAAAFSLPAWAAGAEELTGNSAYANKHLALVGLPAA